MSSLSMKRIYYFPINERGEELEAIPIDLSDEGAVDLSALPKAVRDGLERFGVKDVLRPDPLFPKDGAAFLRTLLRSAGAYARFRQTSEIRIPVKPTDGASRLK